TARPGHGPRGNRAPARGRRDAPALPAAQAVSPLGVVAPAARRSRILRAPDRLPADGLLLVLTAEESNMAEPILEAGALRKHFGALRAVHLSLAIEGGELRCLSGPNGAGKSTFFRMLTGGMRPSSGTVRFRGRDITGWPAFRIARLGISIKFQVASVLEELSVFQNLHLAAEFRFGDREGRRRAAEMLEVVGLSERADHPATWLSHGEKQWLEIGV